MSAGATRCHHHREEFAVSAERLFDLLIRPSAICQWWSAASAIILPRANGIWAATWGTDLDDPDYVTAARISIIEPPKRLVLDNYQYFARAGRLPFDAEFVVEFGVEPTGGGAMLSVAQDGFPVAAIAAGYYAACEAGWSNTFASIRQYLAASSQRAECV